MREASLYNYADYNTISFLHSDIGNLRHVLVQESLGLVRWFEDNFMKANPDKFQSLQARRLMTQSNISR